MPKHEYFEELCSLAAIGELSGPELSECASHLLECASCRAEYQALAQLAGESMPLAGGRVPHVDAESAERVRVRAIQKLGEEGLRISPEAKRGRMGARARIRKCMDDVRWALYARKVQLGLVMVLAVLAAAGMLAVQYERASRDELEALRANADQSRVETMLLQGRLNAISATATDARNTSALLEKKLAETQALADTLETRHAQDANTIGSLEARIEVITAHEHEMNEKSASADREVASLQGEVQRLRENLMGKDADLAAEHYRMNELAGKLRGQQVAIDKERQLLAANRDIRNIMGARDLHIIDVHDMDSRGESKPFGRIFLTEGKQLIFYAYDLNSVKAKNVAFQAWGQRSDTQKPAVSLGILYLDDKKQSRWTLKVEDPNILKAIESVFVTVEPPGGAHKPTGKKLMYAYLRNPINHP